MKTLKRLGVVAAAVVGLAATTGCSTQFYGSPGFQNFVSNEGAQTKDVFANLGQPDAIYETPQGQVYLYRYAEGENILWIYSKVKRTDTLIGVEDDEVKWVNVIEAGEGVTWLAPPYMPATYPVSPDYLLGDISDFSVVIESEGAGGE